jgi:GNAT superfamily N-acetyltransferase
MIIRDITVEDAYDILKDVEPDIPKSEFLEKYHSMLSGSVKVYGLFDKYGVLCTISVVSIQENDCYGKYLYLYDLVTEPNRRNKGYGKEMLNFLHNFAIYNNCEKITLNSGLHRTNEHKFLKSNGFQPFHYAFIKDLKDNKN